MEGDAAPRHRGDDRLVHRVDDLLDLLGTDPRHRRVAAHAAGVRPLVAVEDPLVVLGRGEWDDVLAVAEREQRELFTLEELLQHDGRCPKRRSVKNTSTASRASASLAQMITPLPAASPSALSTAG